MSIYKEKAAFFENIFSNLESDSDEELSIDKQELKRALPDDIEHTDLVTDQESPTKSLKLTTTAAAAATTAATTSEPIVKPGTNVSEETSKSQVGAEDVINISSSSDDGCNDGKYLSSKCQEQYYDVNSDAGSNDDIVEINSNDAKAEASSQNINCTPIVDDMNDNPDAEESSFFEDYNYKLRINRSGRYERFSMTYKSKISDTLKDLIASLARSGKYLVLTKDGETVSLDSSPHSLKLSPGDVLDAIEIQPDKFMSATKKEDDTTAQCIDTNVITLKLQDGNRKHSKEFLVAMDEPLIGLKEKYAQEFDIDIICMKLSFDGDTIDDQQTPEQLDMEDGCVVDVLLPQTVTYVSPPTPIDLVSPVKKKTPRRGPQTRSRRRRGR